MNPASASSHPLRAAGRRLGGGLVLLWLGVAGAALAGTGPLHGARQLVLVSTAGWEANQGTLHRYERSGDAAAWHEVAAFPVSIGRNGSAWGTGPLPAMRSSSAATWATTVWPSSRSAKA